MTHDVSKMLGLTYVDRITGFKGYVDYCYVFLTGCDRVSLQPPFNKEEGTWRDSASFDISSLALSSEEPLEKGSTKAHLKPLKSQIKGLKNPREILGYYAKDNATGIEGIIDTVSIALDGTIRISIQPPLSSKGTYTSSYYVTPQNLEIDLTKERIVINESFEVEMPKKKKPLKVKAKGGPRMGIGNDPADYRPGMDRRY